MHESPILVIEKLGKVYDSGKRALKTLDLTIRRGEIFALLGPNGAGKTTLIGIVCSVVRASEGCVQVAGYDLVRDARRVRAKIGLVPQDLPTDAFGSVWASVSFSRGLFGLPPDPAYLEQVLRSLALWDKKDLAVRTLSGGMKRRVLIAKALAHEPEILFLDEPTAGVDVELRHEMWKLMRQLRDRGVTLILTTHYLEEAQEMADRVGVIDHGELILVEETAALIHRLGKRRLTLQLQQPLAAIPEALAGLPLELTNAGNTLVYAFDQQSAGVAELLEALAKLDIRFKDLHSSEASLEEIFVALVRRQP